jgi:hypothetical protein
LQDAVLQREVNKLAYLHVWQPVLTFGLLALCLLDGRGSGVASSRRRNTKFISIYALQKKKLERRLLLNMHEDFAYIWEENLGTLLRHVHDQTRANLRLARYAGSILPPQATLTSPNQGLNLKVYFQMAVYHDKVRLFSISHHATLPFLARTSVLGQHIQWLGALGSTWPCLVRPREIFHDLTALLAG